jgi:hypothetical protein
MMQHLCASLALSAALLAAPVMAAETADQRVGFEYMHICLHVMGYRPGPFTTQPYDQNAMFVEALQRWAYTTFPERMTTVSTARLTTAMLEQCKAAVVKTAR